jgi:hypothetical protein
LLAEYGKNVTHCDFSLDATKEKNMTLSQTYRTALIAIAGSLLTAVFHMEGVAQANPVRGVRNIVIVHGAIRFAFRFRVLARLVGCTCVKSPVPSKACGRGGAYLRRPVVWFCGRDARLSIWPGFRPSEDESALVSGRTRYCMGRRRPPRPAGHRVHACRDEAASRVLSSVVATLRWPEMGAALKVA